MSRYIEPAEIKEGKKKRKTDRQMYSKARYNEGLLKRDRESEREKQRTLYILIPKLSQKGGGGE